ncbi:MAG: DUF58 domain-containing protein [Bacteroidota bacterium]
METSELLKKVRKIEIKSRGLTRHIFAGQYHSAFKGKGIAFSEVREYQYGDDIRSIDWNVTARLRHPFIKVFDEERELTVMLLIDVSASNQFGTQVQFKQELITEIAAVLAFSAINNNDKVGVVFFSDKVEKFIPPKKGSSHILRIVSELLNFKPQQKGTDISEVLRFITNAIKKRSTVFLLSDFMTSKFEDALKIANSKHDLVALRIFDPRETELPNVGLMKVMDAESGKQEWMDTSNSNLRAMYARQWKQHEAYLKDIVSKSGVDMVQITNGEDYVKPLLKFFKMRGARH